MKTLMKHVELTDSYTDGVYAPLRDGTYMRIRTARPTDWHAVYDFGDALGRESVYRRFHGVPKHPGRLLANATCTPVPDGDPPSRATLLALLDGRIVGLAEWIRTHDPHDAEVALAVGDDHRLRGVASLLAVHLREHALAHGIRTFSALIQGDNHALARLLTALGVPDKRAWQDGSCILSIDLHATPTRQAPPPLPE